MTPKAESKAFPKPAHRMRGWIKVTRLGLASFPIRLYPKRLKGRIMARATLTRGWFP